MDVFGLITLPAWLAVILLVTAASFTLFTIYTIYCQTFFWRKGIPGPTPTPYLGSFSLFIKKGVIGTDIEITRTYGKVAGLYVGNLPSVLVSDVDLIKQLCIKDFSKCPNRTLPLGEDKYLKGGMSLTRDENWKFIRSSLSPAFSSGKIRQMVPIMQHCADSLVKKLKEDTSNGETIDICPYCGAYSMDVIASTAFGMDIDVQNNKDSDFVKNSKIVFSRGLANPLVLLMIFMPFLRFVLPKLNMSFFPKKVAKFFISVVDTVVADKKSDKEARKDLMWLMMNAHKDIGKSEDEYASESRFNFQKRPLTSQEILANSLIFFLAGYETTANVLSFVMYNLAIYPEYADEVTREVDENIGKEKPTYDNVSKLAFLDQFTSEVLRLYGSASRFNRILEEDIVLNGYKIPKDTDVQFPVTAIHRDPELWPDPEVFDPSRFLPENKDKRHPYAWIPFGVGPRNCVGMRFALTELKMATVALVQNFKLLKCDETEVPITFHKGGFIKAQNGIKIKLQSR